MNRFAMAGAGRLGAPLARALCRGGYSLTALLRRRAEPLCGFPLVTDCRRLLADADFVFLCIPESQIQPLAVRLAETGPLSGKIFFHTANSLTSDELQPLRDRGAAVASFSPLQTFAGNEAAADDLFCNVPFLLEGDAAACRLACELAARLQARVLAVAKEDKLDIHIAAVFAANFLPALLHIAGKQLQRTSLRPDLNILFPLLERTLANIECSGLEHALSGPVQRAETTVLERHLHRLHGRERKIYELLSRVLAALPEQSNGA